MMAKMTVAILDPVQTSARDMDLRTLKRRLAKANAVRLTCTLLGSRMIP